MHESQMYEDNIFITLTYNNENLPKDGSLNLEHYQAFMKRLRRKYPKEPIRFYHCGEYGEVCKHCGLNKRKCHLEGCKNYKRALGRPHYHAILFNFDFPDKVFFREENGYKYYTSKILEERWTHGFCIIGDADFDSAAYVARYVTKKINGKDTEEHYQGRKKEYATMSRGKEHGGIGKPWYKKYKTDVYPHDHVIVKGREEKPPKYYDGMYEHSNPEEFIELANRRGDLAWKHRADNTHERRLVKEYVQNRHMKDHLTRKLEQE